MAEVGCRVLAHTNREPHLGLGGPRGIGVFGAAQPIFSVPHVLTSEAWKAYIHQHGVAVRVTARWRAFEAPHIRGKQASDRGRRLEASTALRFTGERDRPGPGLFDR